MTSLGAGAGPKIDHIFQSTSRIEGGQQADRKVLAEIVTRIEMIESKVRVMEIRLDSIAEDAHTLRERSDRMEI